MSKTRHRRKVKKTIVIVSNDINRVEHQYSLSRTVFLVLFLMMLLSAGVAFACFYVDQATVRQAKEKQSSLETQIATLKSEKSEIKKLNEELLEKNAIMGATLEELAQFKEERDALDALAFVPSGLPANKVLGMQEVEGDGTIPDNIVESYTNEEGEVVVPEELASLILSAVNPIVLFQLQEGSQVMAVATGTVIDVLDDPDYGYMVRIDHGNGYVSIYRCNLATAVKVGDQVVKGDMLFDVAENALTLGYQIVLNGTYINPMDVMQLKG